jgi:hypothetical protein
MKPDRLKGTFNALIAIGALFCAVFVLLSVQMVLGNDPALGAGRAAKTRAAQQAAKAKRDQWQAKIERGTDTAATQPAPQSDQTYVQPQQTYVQPQQTYVQPQQTYQAPSQYVAPAPVQSSTS